MCDQTGTAIATCKTDALTWPDVGARSRSDFVATCKDDWARAQTDLASAQTNAALGVCDDASATLDDLSCEEVIALFSE